MRNKRNKMLVVRLKSIVLVVVALALTAVSVWAVSASTAGGDSYNDLGFTVVVDAGHGGADGGVTGTMLTEADLNLAVSKKLVKLLNAAGVKVVETRPDNNGLYGTATSGRKIKDMNRRRDIIEAAAPDAVVSIHMNAFAQTRQRGAQCFYRAGNSFSEALARTIARSLSNNIEHCDRAPLAEDYFILNCTDYPTALVECGFLSNAEDEQLLNSAEYQDKIAYYIYCGIMYFLYGGAL